MSKCRYAFWGHHKCSTRWMNDILRAVCKCWKIKLGIIFKSEQAGGGLDVYARTRGIEFLSFINAEYGMCKTLGRVRAVHLIRDPRDIVVSAYFSHRYSHAIAKWPELAQHRETLEKLSFEKGLTEELKFSERNLGRIENWDYADPEILELKVEEVHRDPAGYLAKIFRHYGWGVPENRLDMIARAMIYAGNLPRFGEKDLERIAARNSFSEKSGGRKEGQEDIRSHYRKGIAGDWRYYFSREHIDYFKQHYQNLLIRTGYETADDWGDCPDSGKAFAQNSAGCGHGLVKSGPPSS